MSAHKVIPQMTESDERRFFAKVAVPDESGCARWLASKLPNGYGRFVMGGRAGGGVYVHRLSYQHFVGPIPPGMEVDHLCHIRDCVTPDHLRAITHGQNCQNRAGAQPKSLSGIRGVYWSTADKVWRATAKLNRRGYALGSFSTREEAEAAATAWRAANMPYSHLDKPTVTRYSGHGIGHTYRADVTR